MVWKESATVVSNESWSGRKKKEWGLIITHLFIVLLWFWLAILWVVILALLIRHGTETSIEGKVNK
jgi:ABC-type proline/glycine betaine transport system permease subunit